MFGNLRNRRNINLVTSEQSMKKMATKTSFRKFTIFHQDLIAVEWLKVELVLNRPIYVGFSVLDLSKLLMYDFHNNFIKLHYPNKKSTLLFTDTDSLTYKIQSADIYSEFKQHSELFDFSAYPSTYECFSLRNKKVIGKLKDELNGIIMERIRLVSKAKLYRFLCSGERT